MDGTSRRAGPLDWINQPLVRVALYYIALAIGVLILHGQAPDLYRLLSSGELPAVTGAGETFDAVKKSVRFQSTGIDISVLTIIGMAATFVLMVPVVWIYTFTRQKRGYQQSLVQTLVILPIVVAAVVILVKNSVALAFSLGGIVGAVSFRNRLADTKDAIYVFLAIATGLACGVEVIKVGLALTMFFNAIILLLWYTDLGRVPAQLAAGVAQRRVEQARSMAADAGNQRGDFVAALDRQILQSMTPEQLSALAIQAKKRQRKLASSLYDTADGSSAPKFSGVLRITAAEGIALAVVRESVERILGNDVKRWQFVEATAADNPARLSYQVRCRKSVPGPILAETLRRTLLAQAAEVSFE
ncbi:MAG: DUF4956 domain-containing protein [Gemmatimonadota bacterium]